MDNLFRSLPESFKEEVFDPLLQTKHFRLERIVSAGHATPPGQWLKQADYEWVVLLRGRAVLRFKDPAAEYKMSPGEYINIPANTSHRVEWTDPSQETVWLALHYR